MYHIRLCENNYDENSDKYRINYIKNNFSKRPQNSNNDLPDIITNNYVFIPTQKHNDIVKSAFVINVFIDIFDK